MRVLAFESRLSTEGFMSRMRRRWLLRQLSLGFTWNWRSNEGPARVGGVALIKGSEAATP